MKQKKSLIYKKRVRYRDRQEKEHTEVGQNLRMKNNKIEEHVRNKMFS